MSGWLRHVYSPWMEWYWQCLLLPLLYKTGALLACGMSDMLTWSEVATRHVYSPWMEWYWQCLLLPLLNKTGPCSPVACLPCSPGQR